MKSRSSLVRVLALTLAMIGAAGAQLAVMGEAQAKRAQCYSTPVPSQPGVYIWTCTTTRP